MIKGLPALISSSTPSIWASCRTITPNLSGAYHLSFKNRLNNFGFSVEQTEAEVQILARQIARSLPTKIIFIDHRPHPLSLMKALKKEFGRKKMPPLFFHVYGDFTLYSGHWFELNNILRNQEVTFICASPRQKDLLNSFLFHGRRSIHVIPFPVNSSDYYFDPSIRTRKRKELKLTAQDKLIVYTGRLCLQKNVLRLIREIADFMKTTDKRIFLYLAGSFDDSTPPLFGPPLPQGAYFQEYVKLLNQIPKKHRDRINYLGTLDLAQLKELYNSADIFMSLSTYHDEDYGMSPIEALFCGCPAVLSDWGGFSGFDINPQSCLYIPVNMDKVGPFIKSKDVQITLKKILNREHSEIEKNKQSSLYQKQFSLEAIAQSISKLHSAKTVKFKGYSVLMKTHVVRTGKTGSQEIFHDGFGRDSFYHKIYKNYLKETK
jgi:glycosyltransferase involved in cell wall biosynthesis